MRVLLFGASGMVGQGVLRECLLDPEVAAILSIVRKPTGRTDRKLREIVHPHFLDFSPIESELSGFDAGFFCAGVSSAGMTEEEYRRVTYDQTMAAAGVLARLNPQMTFVYVSGAGTDSTENGRTMWARVKGRTENALLRLSFRSAYMFRPALIQPLHGIRSGTRAYRVLYGLLGPLLPILRVLLPGFVTTTERLGRAMLEVAKNGAPARVLNTPDINALAKGDARREATPSHPTANPCP
ncbi:MAG: epimerase [Acidobacteriota bacterium]